MLRLFFHRNSLFVKIAYFMALALTIAYLFIDALSQLNILQEILFFFFIGQTLFAQGVLVYPWYPKNAAGPGIKLQFQKAMVPVAYLWLVMIALLWIKPYTFLLILWNLLLLPISLVACILIYFHCQDPDPSRPNLLSGAK